MVTKEDLKHMDKNTKNLFYEIERNRLEIKEVKRSRVLSFISFVGGCISGGVNYLLTNDPVSSVGWGIGSGITVKGITEVTSFDSYQKEIGKLDKKYEYGE